MQRFRLIAVWTAVRRTRSRLAVPLLRGSDRCRFARHEPAVPIASGFDRCRFAGQEVDQRLRLLAVPTASGSGGEEDEGEEGEEV